MTKSKRFIAIISVMVLLINTCFISAQLVSQAAGVAKQYTAIDTLPSDVELAKYGSSIIDGKIAAVYSVYRENGDSNREDITASLVNNGSATYKSTGVNYLTDGKANTECHLGDTYSSTRTIKADIEFDLGAKSSVTGFLAIGEVLDGYGSKVYLGAYDVYLSDSKDTLYEEGSKIFSYNSKDSTGVHLGQYAKFVQAYEGRYISVRITKSSYDDDMAKRLFARVGEIAIYGEKGMDSYTPIDTLPSQNDLSEFGTSLIAGNLGTVYSTKREDNSSTRTDITQNLINNSSASYGSTNIAYLTDGKANTECHLDTTYSKPRTIQADIEYDLGPNSSVDSFMIIGEVLNGYGDKIYLGAYDVYLGNDQASLYSESNKIFSYDSKSAAGAHLGQYVELSESHTGRYFAIRITKTANDNGFAAYTFARVGEIAVYGKANGDYIDALPSASTISSFGTSIIAGKKATVYSVKREDNTSVRTDITASLVNMNSTNAYMTDGDPSSMCFLDNTFSAPRTINADIEYDLERQCTITGLLIIGQYDISYGNKIYLGAYDVYAGDDLETLYNKDNIIYSYNSNTDGAHLGQHVTLVNEYSCRYIAIRITRSAYDNEYAKRIFARVGEVAVYGDDGKNYKVEYRNEKKLADFITNDQFAAYGTSLIKGKLAEAYSYDAETGEEKVLTGNSEPKENLNSATDTLEMLTDGLVYNGSSATTAQLYYHGGGEIHAMDLVYNLGSSCSVEKFVMLGLSFIYEDNRAYSAGLFTGKYEVYLADSKDNLYKPECLIYSYDYEKDGISRGQIVNFKETPKGMYLAIRILNPVTTSAQFIYPRISEIGVFGTDGLNYSLDYINESLSETLMTDKEFADLGDNILLNQSPRLLMNGVANSTLDWQNSGNKINDGSLSAIASFSWTSPASGKPYLDIIYDLGEDPIDIEKFVFVGHNLVRKHYYTGKYQVFVAEEYDELFLENTKVFEYDRSKDMVSRGQIVTFEEKPRGCYIAVRILDPNMIEYDKNDANNLWICPKISEIGAYGEKAQIISEPMNLANHMPVNAYLTENDGKLKEISNDKFTAENVANLTDGDINTNTVFNTDGKTLNLVYNLCKNMNINKIQVASIQNALSKPKEFYIYASDDINAVWKENALVYSYKSSDNEEDINGITFDSSQKMRYVRIMVPASSNVSCNFSEIQIIGMDNQKLKYKNIALGISPAFVQMFTTNFNNNMVSYLTFDSTVAKGIVDNDKNTVVSVEGGNPEKNSLNLEMYLGDLKTISSIALYFKNIKEYQPQKLYIYAGETESEILDEHASPIAVFNGFPEKSTYQVSFKPMLARYIRICIPESNPLQDDYDTYCIGFTEIGIMGTSVVGTQTSKDNNVLLNYADNATGISWDVIRIDTNDIPSDIATSYIVKTAANNNQKKSLYTANYKIADDNLYQIKFYNLMGDEITDLQGRKVRIKVPISSDMLGGKMLFGRVTDSETIDLYETLENNDVSGSPYIYVDCVQDDGYSFAVTQLSSEDDPYWDSIITRQDDTDMYEESYSDTEYMSDQLTDVIETDEDGDTQTIEAAKKYKKKILRRYKNVEVPGWVLPVAIGGGVVFLAAVTTAVLVIIRKRKKAK